MSTDLVPVQQTFAGTTEIDVTVFNAEEVEILRLALGLARLSRLRQLIRGEITTEECHTDLARMYQAGRKLGSPPDVAWERPSWHPLPGRNGQ